MADLEGVGVSEFGKTIRLYCKHKGELQNISGYSSGAGEIIVKFWSPKPVKQIDVVAGYTSTGNGADGIVEFAMTSDAPFDRSGTWHGQVWLEKTGFLVKSKKFSVLVSE